VINGVVLHHDIAQVRTAAVTVETVRELKFELLARATYSSDPAPSGYHTFGPLKDALRGRRFSNDEQVKDAVHTSLRAQP
jgi:hypothetical protein